MNFSSCALVESHRAVDKIDFHLPTELNYRIVHVGKFVNIFSRFALGVQHFNNSLATAKAA